MTTKLRDHRFFRDPSTMHPTCVWALLELGHAFELELAERHIPRLHTELLGDDRDDSAALLTQRLDHDEAIPAKLYAPMRAAYSSWRSSSASAVTACASYRLSLALAKAFGDAPLDGRVGAYVITQLALADIRAYLDEILDDLDFDEPHPARSVKELAELLEDSPFARRMFRTGAKRMTLALWEIFDELHDLACHLEAESSQGSSAPC